MNITLAFQELDDLIVKHTTPPTTAMLRNKLHPLRDQIEAYISNEDHRAKLSAEIQAEHVAFKLGQATPAPQSPTDSFNHRRGLYYKTGDPVPFCPQCLENSARKIHLSGPVEMADKTLERWECYTCNHDYHAHPGENFMPNLSRTRTKPR